VVHVRLLEDPPELHAVVRDWVGASRGVLGWSVRGALGGGGESDSEAEKVGVEQHRACDGPAPAEA
jgi:hypothetical protein